MALQDVVTREYTINLHKRVCFNKRILNMYCELNESRI